MSSISSCRLWRVIASSAPNGSSIISAAGSCARQRAICSRCCMPPDICDGIFVGEARQGRRASSSAAMRAARSARGSSHRLERERDVAGGGAPRQQRLGIVLEHDRDVAARAADRRAGESTSPRVGAMSPTATRSAVVLPQPDGPTTQTISPRRISNVESAEHEMIAEGEIDFAERDQRARHSRVPAPRFSDRRAPASRRYGRRATRGLFGRGARALPRELLMGFEKVVAARKDRHHQAPVAIGLVVEAGARGEQARRSAGRDEPCMEAFVEGVEGRLAFPKAARILAYIKFEPMESGDDRALPGVVTGCYAEPQRLSFAKSCARGRYRRDPRATLA